MRLTAPNVIGDIHFDVGLATGWDRFRELLFSPVRFRLHVARRILSKFPTGALEHTITFTLPGDVRVWRIGAVRVKNARSGATTLVATVEPWRGA